MTVKETDFIQECIHETQNPTKSGKIFGLVIVTLMLWAGFIAPMTFVIHYQHLTITPRFEMSMTTQESPHKPTKSHRVAISIDDYCMDAELNPSLKIVPPEGTMTWYATRNLVCDDSYDLVSNSMGLFLVVSIMLGIATIVPMADFFGRKYINLVLTVISVAICTVFAMS